MTHTLYTFVNAGDSELQDLVLSHLEEKRFVYVASITLEELGRFLHHGEIVNVSKPEELRLVRDTLHIYAYAGDTPQKVLYNAVGRAFVNGDYDYEIEAHNTFSRLLRLLKLPVKKGIYQLRIDTKMQSTKERFISVSVRYSGHVYAHLSTSFTIGGEIQAYE